MHHITVWNSGEDVSLRSDRNGSPTCWRTRDDDGNVVTRTCLKDYGKEMMVFKVEDKPSSIYLL